MPQLPGSGPDDLGANDEMIAFKDEGEQEERPAGRAATERDLDDLKSSLVNESEEEPARQVPCSFPTCVSCERCSGGLPKGHIYSGYPFLVLPDLTAPYLSHSPLSPHTRTVSLQFLHVGKNRLHSNKLTLFSPSLQLLQSNKVPVVQPSHPMHPLTPLLAYGNEHFAHGAASPHLPDIDPKTGIPRPPQGHDLSPYYPLPGQLPHPLCWQGQPVYPLSSAGFRHPYPTALTVSTPSLYFLCGSLTKSSCPVFLVQGKKKKRRREKQQVDVTGESNANSPKKCRALFGLEQQSLWCKPCRRKKKCIRYLPGEGDNSPHSADRSLIDSPPPSPVPWDSPSSPSDHAHLSPSLCGTSQIQPSVLLPKSESRGPNGMPQVVLRPPTISHPGTSGAS
uniref:Transcription factor 7 like 2 n=1 Tax=Eptatretus burgeri TaxID=7764 RepID=A0A8C4X071_EPTBU